MKKIIALGGVLIAVLLGAVGCSKFTEPWNDAKIEKKDDSPAEVYSMPDGFNNFSTKCDQHGNRVYVLYHNDQPYGGITVVPNDPSCTKR